MLSQSEENYLKAIYQISKDAVKGASTNAIAKSMNTKASSVTDMIKKLSEKELVFYRKYQGVTLTKVGESTAINIIRKHRLWEVFLVEKLNFSWEEVHEVAEQLEHIRSPKLINELDSFLGSPKHDPHGDPIPDRNGKIHTIQKILLSECKIGEKGECIGVNDTSTEFLKFLSKKNIEIGKIIMIKEKEDFDDSLVIEIDGKNITISNKIASNLYIKN